jgi:hypothetical protein
MTSALTNQVELSIGGQYQALRIADQTQCLIHCNAKEVSDLRTAIQAAFETPVEFPPFSQTIFQGDRIALAVDPYLPQGDEIVACTVQCLLELGAVASDIDVVLGTGCEALQGRLTERLPQGCTVQVHNPEDPNGLAYIGAAQSAEPIYINRLLFDADVVIPCLLARQNGRFEFGGAAGIVPQFVDRKTQKDFENKYFRGQTAEESVDVDDPGWLLGIIANLVFVPGSDNAIAGVWAGEARSTMKTACRDLESALPNVQDQMFDLAIVAVDTPQKQTWSDVVRAIEAAQATVSNRGSIVVLSSLNASMDGAMTMLASLDDDDKLLKRLTDTNLPNSSVARALLDARTSHQLFLLSNLERESVEAIGLGYVEHLQEVENLIRRSERSLVLSSAQNRWKPNRA